jgi:hypothetical protein
MKAKLIIAVAVFAAFMSGCSRYHYSEARMVGANDVDLVVVTPTVKVQVDPAAFQDVWSFEGEELRTLKPRGLPLDVVRERLKVAATYKSLQKHNGDILVAPLFDVRGELNNHRFVVTVRGYAGKYVDWDKDGVERTVLAPEDMKLRAINVKTNDGENVPVIVPQETAADKVYKVISK